jgi:hypothetical protein
MCEIVLLISSNYRAAGIKLFSPIIACIDEMQSGENLKSFWEVVRVGNTFRNWNYGFEECRISDTRNVDNL